MTPKTRHDRGANRPIPRSDGAETKRPNVYRDDARLRLQRFLDAHLRTRSRVTVLDAGAGQTLPLDLPRDVHLVALDISSEQLKRNQNADEKIVGDLQSVDLSGRTFDIVVCWDVLEHLPRPEAAVAQMASWLRPG